MAVITTLCWALIFIIRIRFLLGKSLATILNPTLVKLRDALKLDFMNMPRNMKQALLHSTFYLKAHDITSQNKNTLDHKTLSERRNSKITELVHKLKQKLTFTNGSTLSLY